MLQDEILGLVFAENTEFYLTGGTCLNRFYFEKRYSDDLDFFTNFSDTFPYAVRETYPQNFRYSFYDPETSRLKRFHPHSCRQKWSPAASRFRQ